MDIKQLLNTKNNYKNKTINEYLEGIEQVKMNKWKHLNWKEKRRIRALRWKLFRKGLTRDEWVEYKDLNFIEVIITGQALEKENKEKYIKELRQKSNIFNRQEQIRERQRKYNQTKKEEMSK
jgi:hypothetical protein